MWTELPQTVCVQDPQQLQRGQEETAVQRLPAGLRHVRRSSTFHWVHPDAAGGGEFTAVAWSQSHEDTAKLTQKCALFWNLWAPRFILGHIQKSMI